MVRIICGFDVEKEARLYAEQLKSTFGNKEAFRGRKEEKKKGGGELN